MSTTKQFGLTDQEIAAILKALQVRINDLHALPIIVAPATIQGTCESRQSICRSFTINSRLRAESTKDVQRHAPEFVIQWRGCCEGRESPH
jgi:hypothetical protein